ncbi:MAG: molybdopterin-dependent oxidoreductase [Rhodospirillaceae bacterium]|jgi:anaerobic selenocysteine-containing dehydrogenase|nr:molybdopterin-dependent oxidoreductase [Rhodospirillaceae bacterium]MBT4587860.1 molybdopterin-dependent oxidoreductase [Rhodospirillaceae bacterium]MBT4937642.1 molybdopterin-dependent oxidoreductase [Rhodospirillaceae bacterium]MBT5938871.1 molybdopterin-dependent oxidoreductase [Rhodospirillaceae bacterium]MBT7267393.1 molybdopterin-dependent oxidoreductase [Rhodospirillaceae bacterium]
MSNAIAWSVCPHDCASACGLDVEIKDSGQIGRVHGSKDNPYTAGVVCAKVARYAERVHHPQRLTRPLRRKGKKSAVATLADFEEISWDEALDIVAEGFTTAAQKQGPETVWLYNYGGTMGLAQKGSTRRLRNAMGYSRQLDTICAWILQIGVKAGLGKMLSVNPLEFAESDLIVVWGSNPVHTQINLMTHISRARKERGARLVVIDPYPTATARQADTHLQLRPGTDGALAAAVMHVLFRDGYADEAYMAEYTDDPAALEAHLKTRTPEWAAAITGLSVAEIEAFAKEYGTTERALIRMGIGFSRSRNGAANIHAVSSLPAVRGAWKHPGGGLYSATATMFPIDLSLINGPETDTRWLDMSRLGPILNGDAELLGGGPPVTAMLVQNSNPAAVAPESALIRKGLMRDDMFLVVHEQFLTDTAMLADIILPATTFVEHDDLYTSFGHTHLQIGTRVIEPLGEARCNHDVIAALANRLGVDDPAFAMTAWEMIDETLKKSGFAGADALKDERQKDVCEDFETSHGLNGFGHPDGKFHFRADWAAIGEDWKDMPTLPDFANIIDEADADRPYRMVTAPSRNYLNTTFTETETSISKEVRPTVKMSPADCKALEVNDGDVVRLGNDCGDLLIHVKVLEGARDGVVIVESVWPNTAFIEGIGINMLTSSKPAAPAGGAAFHDTAIWISPEIELAG